MSDIVLGTGARPAGGDIVYGVEAGGGGGDTTADIILSTDARPAGADIVFGVESGGGPPPDPDGSYLEFVVPIVPINTVLVAICVHEENVAFSDPSWTHVRQDFGGGGFEIDVHVKQVDAAYRAQLKAAETRVGYLSLANEELMGGMARMLNVDPAAIIEASAHAPFTADAAPIAPASAALSHDDTVLCIWASNAIVDFTPPAAFTEIDEYASSVIDPSRSLMIAYTTAAEIGPAGPVEPGAATASPAATGRAFTLVLRYLSPGLVQVPPLGVATPKGTLGLLDMFIDPITLDYVDTDDGEWLETADSRTAVMIAIDTRAGQSYATPGDGTRIAEMLERGDPLTPDLVGAEITRGLRVLENTTPPMIRGVSVRVVDGDRKLLVDEAGRFSPEIRYTDLASGSPVDLVIAPFQGGI